MYRVVLKEKVMTTRRFTSIIVNYTGGPANGVEFGVSKGSFANTGELDNQEALILHQDPSRGKLSDSQKKDVTDLLKTTFNRPLIITWCDER